MASSENIFGVANYYALWSQSMATTMSQFTGKELAAETSGPVDDASEDRLWVTFTISDGLLGEQAFSATKADALLLGQLFIGETADPNAEFTPDHADAFAELFRQFAGTVALQLKGVLGKECTVRFKDAEIPSWASAETASLIVRTEPSVTVSMRMDTGLLNSITKSRVVVEETPEPVPAVVEEPVPEPEQPVKEETQPVVESVPQEEPAPAPQSVARPAINDKNLDLLLDVELEVSVRFGRRQMLLKDVLDLSSGSMVELDRCVRDPIELLLGGRVIARGEAVIVDGSYGIRITEVVSPGQRLAEIA